MFMFFTGLSPAGSTDWGRPAWHFFLALLYHLKLLLGGTWRSAITDWATPGGCLLPAQVATDALVNVFNVSSASGLDVNMQRALDALTHARGGGGAAGARFIDLDALLLLLVNEHTEGHAPRSPLLFPRRVTDLFTGRSAAADAEATAARDRSRMDSAGGGGASVQWFDAAGGSTGVGTAAAAAANYSSGASSPQQATSRPGTTHARHPAAHARSAASSAGPSPSAAAQRSAALAAAAAAAAAEARPAVWQPHVLQSAGHGPDTLQGGR
ncbi:hypothetical protein FOA52_005624 [Chlamydomonas sp. UWO 241]|nr:hypothetical protein FOA52_005624 [Chlamydomonas sp. UWO 241]